MANSDFNWRPASRMGIAQLMRRLVSGAIPFIPNWEYWYRAQCRIVGTGTNAVITGPNPGAVQIALPASVGPFDVDLHTLFPTKLFPRRVFLVGTKVSVRVRVNTVGLTTCTLSVGDTGAPTGLVNAQNLHTGTADREIIGAGAEANYHEEAAGFIPSIRLTSTVNNLNVATAGSFDILIPFVRRPD